jgi:hypothetical protein
MTDLLLGVAASVWVVPMLLRWGVWRWLAVVAGLAGAAGVATLDGLSDASVVSAALAGLTILVLCRELPPPRLAVVGAALTGVAAVTAWVVSDAEPATIGASAWLLAVSAAVGLAGALGAGGAPAPLRLACAVPLAVSAVGLVVTGGDAVVPLAWAPAVAALGLTAMLRGRRRSAAGAPQTDEVDEQVVASFAREHPGLRFPPVVVVIAAYNEADGLPAVLRALPRQVLGMQADVLVVDDGSSDGTAEDARAAGGCRVAACPANRGQGRALRLGYRLARRHGAAYVVTTDADGQYSPDDIPAVLGPVVEGRADFVTGSRRLGRLENRDAVRQAGTYVFAWLASMLLGRRITDTSFGLRALRADLTGELTLNQPQYQASELLVGVVSHGYRVLEVPATLRVRSAGSSKKGGNLVYGARYARVMIGTWWREGCPRPVAETAPALRGSPRHVPVDVPA